MTLITLLSYDPHFSFPLLVIPKLKAFQDQIVLILHLYIEVKSLCILYTNITYGRIKNTDPKQLMTAIISSCVHDCGDMCCNKERMNNIIVDFQ